MNLSTIVGQWHWQPPSWLPSLGRRIAPAFHYLTASPRRISIAAGAVMAIALGWYAYQHRPLPHYVTYALSPPPLTEYNDRGISTIYPLFVQFSESAAPLSRINKPVPGGVSLSPRLAGTWQWLDDHRLQFVPRNDWPIDQKITVSFARKGLFASGVRLDDYSADFRTQPFAARIAESQFYQDPRDPSLKKLVATVAFSHPVDPAEFEHRVSLAVARDAGDLGLKPDSRNYTVVYDEFHLAAFVHSAPLAMPRDDTPMTLLVEKGVRAARGGNDTHSRLQAVVVVPGRSSLRFSGARMAVVDNARYEPEQILMLSSSSPVAEKALAGKVSAWILPERHPKHRDAPYAYAWNDPSDIGKDILALSQPLPLTYVSSEEGGDTSHAFRFKAPVGRYLFVSVPEGVEGTGG